MIMAFITDSVLTDTFIVAVAIVTTLYWLVTRNFDHWRKKGIPYLEPKPILGNLQDVAFRKMGMGKMLAKFYLQNREKPYVGIFAVNRPILLACDLEFVKSVLVRDFKCFRDRTFHPDERFDPLFAKNLFGLKEPRWRHLRAKLAPTFTSGKLKVMIDLVNECGREMCNLVKREMKNADSCVLEVKEILARYTTDVIASVGFGVQANSLKDPDAEFRLILRKVVEWKFLKGLKLSMAFLAPKLLSLFHLRIFDPTIVDFTRRVVWQTVNHRERTGIRRNDFLDLLMQIRSKGHVDEEEPQDIPEEQAKDPSEDPKYKLEGDDFVAQAFAFLVAGFETSATTQTFALYELACHVDVQTRLRQEVRNAVRANGGRLTYDAVQTLPLLDHVVRETLRLYPVIPFLDRVCLEDYRLPNGAVLEKGSTVMISTLGIQHNPEYFEDPDSFRPERFEEGKSVAPAFSILPFGEGPRMCMGMRMGLMQVKVGLSHFLDHFEVRPSKHTKTPVEMDPNTHILSPKGGMPLVVSRVPGCLL